MTKKVLAIVGSYRKGGTIDSAVQAILGGARERGAETRTIYLTDQHLEFCTNCRSCTQTPGPERGSCTQKDDLQFILAEIDSSDVLVLGSSVNYWNVTALFRRFMERLIGCAYWPWGGAAPRLRTQRFTRQAVLVASAAMPGFCIPLLTGAARALRITAKSLDGKPIAHLWIGFTGKQPDQKLPPRTLEQARRIGLRLA
ncbi:MAG: flavodoxin family protein [Acidobacteriaceae bacterium]|nr:flavodoxin family protein [Acidobacteriaceae bacterium]